MKELIVCIVTTALCFGRWPLIARSAGHTGIIGTLIMASMATVPIGAVALYQGASRPSPAAIPHLLIAGLMMGIGFITYHLAISNHRTEVSITVPVISGLLVSVSVIGGLLFYSEHFTLQKAIGIVLLIAAIFLLRPATQKTSDAQYRQEPLETSVRVIDSEVS